MKKIVALALCLVLALSLCATAFAAGFIGNTHADALTNAANGDTVTEVKQLTDARSTVVAGGDVVYTPATYLLTSTQTVNGVVTNTTTLNAIELASSNCPTATNLRVYVEGTTVRYFYTDTTITVTNTKLSATTTVSDTNKAACGVVLANSATSVFEDAAGDYYIGVGNTPAFVDGKIAYVTKTTKAAGTYEEVVLGAVPAGLGQTVTEGKVFAVVHTFKYDQATNKVGATEKTTITKLYCSECGKEFAFVDKLNEAAAKLAGQTKFGIGNFSVVQVGGANGPWFAYEKTGTAAAGTTTAVSSAKTFDAGIALYVGMSISAVAGSAVVIGKKKEF